MEIFPVEFLPRPHLPVVSYPHCHLECEFLKDILPDSPPNILKFTPKQPIPDVCNLYRFL